jgi:hypothetical protein
MCAEATRPVWHADLEPTAGPSLWSKPEAMESTARLLTIDRASFTIRQLTSGRQLFPNSVTSEQPTVNWEELARQRED